MKIVCDLEVHFQKVGCLLCAVLFDVSGTVLHQHAAGVSARKGQGEVLGGLMREGEVAVGLVAVMPIGMSQVASVNIEPMLKVGDRVEKGDMLGYFLFGGSDFVLVFQKKAAFELLSPKKDGGGYEHILMGEKLGRMNT